MRNLRPTTIRQSGPSKSSCNFQGKVTRLAGHSIERKFISATKFVPQRLKPVLFCGVDRHDCKSCPSPVSLGIVCSKLSTGYLQLGTYFAALATFTPRELAAYRAMPLYSASAICSR